jgi:hypothetical protein
MSQSHGATIWREPAGSGAVPSAVRVYFVPDGAGGVTISTTGPERYAAYDVAQDGNYTLLDLTPVYLVSDGAGGYQPSLSGPAIALLVDDGASGVTVSTNLSLTPIADLFYDTGGDLWLVRRTCPRLEAVQVGSNVYTY